MAEQIKLVQYYDIQGDGTALDLLDSSGGGWCLREGGWTPAQSNFDGKHVYETLSLRVVGAAANHNSLSTELQYLAAQIEAMKEFKANRLNKGLWLRVQAASETNGRQSPIYGMRGGRQITPANYAYRTKAQIPNYLLTIERAAWWESTGLRNYTTGVGTYANVVGGVWNYGDNDGDTIARLARLTVATTTAGAGYNEVWGGFRTGKYGTLANFQSTWSLRKGAFGTDTTGGTSHVDATCKDGYRTDCTFATSEALVRRVTCEVQDISANYEDQRGEYLVLLRCKLSAAGEVRVRMAEGFSSNAAFRVHYRQSVTEASYWRYYPLGTVKIPPGGIQSDARVYSQYFALGIDAERVSGSPTLYMDCLVMVPVGEGGFYLSDGDISFTTTTHSVIVNTPDEEVLGYNFTSGNVAKSVNNPQINDGVPAGNGSLVLACQGSLGSDVLHDFYVGLWFAERWYDLRGSDT